ncbi:MAG: VOC family protein [Nitrososphaera sp.]|jgi:catechol 2,3-dioxygenase-like lactoylglutathione lyase family enzyme
MIKDSDVTVMVSDMKRAIRFYVEGLGFKLVANYGDHYAQIIAPGIKIGLHPTENGNRSQPGAQGISIGFMVDDLNVALARVSEIGVSSVRIVNDGPVTLAHFADPDGNPLYFAEERKR